MSFKLAFNKTMGNEVGYSTDPHDPGGETFNGCSRKNFPNEPFWKLVDKLPVKNTKTVSAIPGIGDMIRAFYKKNFWDKLLCDEIDAVIPIVASKLFDCSVNSGTGQGPKFLQRALNAMNVNGTLYPDVAVGGGIGNETINAVKACCSSELGRRVLTVSQNGELYIFYKNNPLHERYRGWMARTCDIHDDDLVVGSKIITTSPFNKKIWADICGDAIAASSPLAAIKLHDYAVTMSVNLSVSFFQEALNTININNTLYQDLKVDGVMTPETIKATNICCKSQMGRKLLSACQTGELYTYFKKSNNYESFREQFAQLSDLTTDELTKDAA